MRFRMPRDALHQLAERHTAGFGMVAGPLEGALGQGLQQFVILSAKTAERLERLLRLATGIIQVASPQFLVEGDQCGIVLGRDLPATVAAHQFRIGQVRHNLPCAPLLRRGPEILLLSENSGQNHSQKFRTAAESFQ